MAGQCQAIADMIKESREDAERRADAANQEGIARVISLSAGQQARDYVMQEFGKP